jgi:hypothetical protein
MPQRMNMCLIFEYSNPSIMKYDYSASIEVQYIRDNGKKFNAKL